MEVPDDPEIEFITDAAKEVFNEIGERIDQFNSEHSKLDNVHRLALVCRNHHGELIAGLSARTWGKNAHILVLWVEDALRGKGVGTRLMERFEKEASALGVSRIILETFSFQAPAFYKKMGYFVAYEVDGFPDDVVKYHYEKGL